MSEALRAAAERLRRVLAPLRFAAPVVHVYRPLDYAWDLHASYLDRYGQGPKRVLFLGMNPGPFGMVQTGVPFGEVAAVRDWLKISGRVLPVADAHPKRPVLGLDCTRSEVSGRRLWGLFASRFGTAEAFFREHFVVNWCPLAFVEDSGRNRTPDQLPEAEWAPVERACDQHLREVVAALKPAVVVGTGGFAEAAAQRALGPSQQVARVPHPSPANPQANKDWAGAATRALVAQGVWRATA